MTLSSRAVVSVALIPCLLLACNEPLARGPVQKTNERKIHATVVTIRTSIQPANKNYTHTIFIANNRARSGDEVDEWRLFDFAQRRVIFADDLSGTYRSESFDDVAATHRASVAQPLPDGMPRAQFVITGAQQILQGVSAKQSVIRLGAYQRELWIAAHPLIPRGLFAMLQASEPAMSPLAGVVRAADDALLEVQGFPIIDHAELPYENQKLVVDNTVVKIEQRDVPASWLQLPSGYRELQPARAGAGQPPQSK